MDQVSARPPSAATGALLAVRFLTELAMLAGLVTFAVATGGLVGWGLGAVSVLAVAALWGAYVAPRAPRRLRDPWRLVLESALLLTGAVALAAVGLPVLAALHAAVALAAAVLVRVPGAPA